MKAEINERFLVKKGTVKCRFEYMIFGLPARSSIYGRGGKVVGDEDLFAHKALLFLLSYFRKRGMKLSKSFKNWFCQEAFNALGRASEKLVINPKTEDDVNNKQDEA